MRKHDISKQRKLLLPSSLRPLSAVLLLLVWSLLAADKALAADVIAKFTVVEGKVDVLRGGTLPAVAAKSGDSLFVNDVIRTKSRSHAVVEFLDGTVLKISQRSRIDISEYVSADTRGARRINLPRGKVEATVPAKLAQKISLAPGQNTFEINTPNAVAGVRGTRYIDLVNNAGNWVLVKEGTVYIISHAFPEIVLDVEAGQIARIPGKQPPSKKEATEAEKEWMEGDAEDGNAGEELGAEGEDFGLWWLGSLAGLFLSPLPAEELPRFLPPPAFEVGRTTLSGSLVAGTSGQFDFISVIMKDVIFFAPSTGQAPTIWKTDSISGTYSFGAALANGVGSIPVSNGQGITGSFNINQWGDSTWSGSASGEGNLSGGTYTGPVSFQGSVSGSHGGGNSGSFSGTGSGTATH
jgi:hypothetical protein